MNIKLNLLNKSIYETTPCIPKKPILCEKTFVLNFSDRATLCSDVINIIVTQFSFYANFILGLRIFLIGITILFDTRRKGKDVLVDKETRSKCPKVMKVCFFKVWMLIHWDHLDILTQIGWYDLIVMKLRSVTDLQTFTHLLTRSAC